MSDVLWSVLAVVSYLLAGVLCTVVLSSVFSPPARPPDAGPLVSRSTPVSPEKPSTWDREIGYGGLVILWPIALLVAVLIGLVLGLGTLVEKLRGCR